MFLHLFELLWCLASVQKWTRTDQAVNVAPKFREGSPLGIGKLFMNSQTLQSPQGKDPTNLVPFPKFVRGLEKWPRVRNSPRLGALPAIRGGLRAIMDCRRLSERKMCQCYSILRLFHRSYEVMNLRLPLFRFLCFLMCPWPRSCGVTPLKDVSCSHLIQYNCVSVWAIDHSSGELSQIDQSPQPPTRCH